MIHNSPGQRPPKAQQSLVESVEVKEERPARFGIALAIFWVVIAVKSALVAWAIRAYAMPVGFAWVFVPTIVFAVLATWLVLRRRV